MVQLEITREDYDKAIEASKNKQIYDRPSQCMVANAARRQLDKYLRVGSIWISNSFDRYNYNLGPEGEKLVVQFDSGTFDPNTLPIVLELERYNWPDVTTKACELEPAKS